MLSVRSGVKLVTKSAKMMVIRELDKKTFNDMIDVHQRNRTTVPRNSAI